MAVLLRDSRDAVGVAKDLAKRSWQVVEADPFLELVPGLEPVLDLRLRLLRQPCLYNVVEEVLDLLLFGGVLAPLRDEVGA